MKAYIYTKTVQFGFATVVRAFVVSEDDYYNRGPFSVSYSTSHMPDEARAKWHAKQWALKNGFDIVASPDDFS